MNRQKRKQKDFIIPFCEGEAEKLLFSFLKITYSNKTMGFARPINLCGVRDFDEFKRKYLKNCKAYSLKPKKDFKNVNFLFILDNDLNDSKKIEKFILKEGHLLQLCDPNTEGLILSLIGKKQICSTDNVNFRKKCKDNFESHFNCEAHKLKDAQLRKIFSSLKIVQTNLIVLHELFTK